MTRDTRDETAVADEAGFRTALGRLIQGALAAGVAVTGAWEIPTRDGSPNFEVEIGELAKEIEHEE